MYSTLNACIPCSSTLTFICTQHVSPFAQAPTRTIFFSLSRTSTSAFTKSCYRFLSKRNSRSWAFASYKVDLNAKYMQNSSTHRYFHNGGRAWQVSERENTTAHVNPWQCPFKPKEWRRYIDDIFSLWDSNKKDADQFIDQGNKFHCTINFTA